MTSAEKTSRGRVDPTAEREFTALVAQMIPELRNYLIRRASTDSIDDVIAETLTVVWTRWSDMPTDPSQRRGWVYGVLKHRLTYSETALARRGALDRRVRRLRRDESGDPYAEITAEGRVQQILNLLPRSEREAVALTVLGGLSMAEAAEALGCSVSAVTTRIHKARRRLRKALSKIGSEAGCDVPSD